MGFRTPTATKVHLKDFQDEIVALKAIRWEDSVRVDLPEDPETGEPARRETRPALLAELAAITADGPRRVGQTLVFYRVVADAVSQASPDWTVGTLTRKQGEDFEYFMLEDLDESDFDAVVEKFSAAGIN